MSMSDQRLLSSTSPSNWPKASDYTQDELHKMFWYKSSWNKYANQTEFEKGAHGRGRAAEGININMLYTVSLMKTATQSTVTRKCKCTKLLEISGRCYRTQGVHQISGSLTPVSKPKRNFAFKCRTVTRCSSFVIMHGKLTRSRSTSILPGAPASSRETPSMILKRKIQQSRYPMMRKTKWKSPLAHLRSESQKSNPSISRPKNRRQDLENYLLMIQARERCVASCVHQ